MPPAIHWNTINIHDASKLVERGEDQYLIFIECGIRHHDEDWQWDEEPDVTDAFCEVEIIGKKAYKGYFDLRDTMEWRKWKRLADAIRTATCIYRLEIKMSNLRMTRNQENGGKPPNKSEVR